MSDLSAERNSEVRVAVREVLHLRSAVALREEHIRRRVQDLTGEAVTEEEIAAALAFLVSMPEPQVRMNYGPLGSTKLWQITAAGSLAHERGQ